MNTFEVVFAVKGTTQPIAVLWDAESVAETFKEIQEEYPGSVVHRITQTS